jgi:hypothetical protein
METKNKENQVNGVSPLGFGLGVVFAIALIILLNRGGLGAIVAGAIGGGVGMGLGALVGHGFQVLRGRSN